MDRSDHRKARFVEHLVARITACQDDIARQWTHPTETSTRHFVLDDLLPQADVEAIYAAFPRNGDGFFDRDTFRERKKTSANLSAYDEVLSDITYAFQSEQVVDLIAGLLGLKAIEPDPKLYAGGLSMMFPGDYLNPHIDNSHDAGRERYRRLNLLYYVSPDWVEANGCNFELWSDDRRTPKTIVSRQNRLVVMETNKTSWHSVSPNLSDHTRCCVSNYYFSKISPDETDYFHVTSFLGRPEQPLRRVVGVADNALRNTVSKVLKRGRGHDQINKTAE
ncbi:MAG: 2OG-Fe(II) oxygenase [Pseudomonadota bacterium]